MVLVFLQDRSGAGLGWYLAVSSWNVWMNPEVNYEGCTKTLWAAAQVTTAVSMTHRGSPGLPGGRKPHILGLRGPGLWQTEAGGVRTTGTVCHSGGDLDSAKGRQNCREECCSLTWWACKFFSFTIFLKRTLFWIVCGFSSALAELSLKTRTHYIVIELSSFVNINIIKIWSRCSAEQILAQSDLHE